MSKIVFQESGISTGSVYPFTRNVSYCRLASPSTAGNPARCVLIFRGVGLWDHGHRVVEPLNRNSIKWHTTQKTHSELACLSAGAYRAWYFDRHG